MRAGEMSQCLRAFTILAEDWSLILSTHIRQLPTACNFSFRRYNILWPPRSPAFLCTSYTRIQTHTKFNNDERKGFLNWGLE